MSIPQISAETVRGILKMSVCIDLMEDTQAAISSGEIRLPLRSFLPVGEHRGYFGVMPGEVGSAAMFGAKLISQFPSNVADGVPAIQGYILLFDRERGTPTALVDAASITAIRTAAASAAATRVLARSNAGSLALLGYGVQAESHLEAMCCVREIREVRVWGPSIEKARLFCERQVARAPRIIALDTPSEAVRDADILCAVSNASQPLILSQDVSKGAHLNMVGAHTPTHREVDSDTLRRSRVYTEITEFALAEAGDLILAMEEGVFSKDEILGEIGEVFAGSLPGRTSDDQITLYENLGNIAQDIVAASYVAAKLA